MDNAYPPTGNQTMESNASPPTGNQTTKPTIVASRATHKEQEGVEPTYYEKYQTQNQTGKGPRSPKVGERRPRRESPTRAKPLLGAPAWGHQDLGMQDAQKQQQEDGKEEVMMKQITAPRQRGRGETTNRSDPLFPQYETADSNPFGNKTRDSAGKGHAGPSGKGGWQSGEMTHKGENARWRGQQRIGPSTWIPKGLFAS